MIKKKKNDNKPDNLSYRAMFKNEISIVEKADTLLNNPELSLSELKEEYGFLNQQYKKIVNELKKITRVGDMHYKKLMTANEQIQEQKNELESLNKELKKVNAAKDKLYSILAHDLRNAMQFLLFSSELLGNQEEYGKLEEEIVIKYIGKVIKTVGSMSELLENLLQWARSQVGELECRPITLDLHALFSEIIEHFVQNAEEKKIKIHMEIPINTIVYADENMMKAVARNLISNALKFSTENGSLHISSQEQGDFISTSVQDTGVGIPPDILKSLFEIAESQADLSPAKKTKPGLGLILCREFVEKNKGQITAVSTVDKGSTFTFSLQKGTPLSANMG